MLIKLDDSCYVAADQITEVKYNLTSSSFTVLTKDGIGRAVWGDYSDMANFVKTINNAMEKP